MSTIFWLIVFMALMIWGRFGVAGLEGAATISALFLGGLGVRSFLNTFGNSPEAEKKKAAAAKVPMPPREIRYKRGLFRPRPQEIRRRIGGVPPQVKVPYL